MIAGLLDWLAPRAVGGVHPASDLDMDRAKRPYPSFTDHLPWVEYDPDSQTFLLEDARSVGALLEIDPAPCEGHPPEHLETVCRKVCDIFVHSLPHDDIPWVLQWYASDEPVRGTVLRRLQEYVSPVAAGSPFTEAYLTLMERHLERLARPAGYFDDREVTGAQWRARLRRIRLAVYRRLPRGWRSPQGLSAEQELNLLLDRLTIGLGGAGVRARRCTGRDLCEWMLRWFNPRPRVPDRSTETLLDTYPYPGDEDLPYGHDLAESLVLGEPTSDAAGAWRLDGERHVFVRALGLLRSPEIGHLTAERGSGGSASALLDRLPEGTAVTLTIVPMARDRLEQRLDTREDAAAGNGSAAMRTRKEVAWAREEMSRHNLLYPAVLGFYLRGQDALDLARREMDLHSLLLSESIQTVTGEHDLPRLEGWLRFLPMNFKPEVDRSARWSRLTYTDHLARLAPVYGRSRGTGHPGILFYNRGGEPFMIDPLHPEDREANAHLLLLGPTGRGKSATLLGMLMGMLAMRRPRVILVEAGDSFGLAARYWGHHGLNVHRLRITSTGTVSLPLFPEALLLLSEEGGARRRRCDAGEALFDADFEHHEDDHREPLEEALITAALMATGGAAGEREQLTRADLALLQRAILAAARAAVAQGTENLLPVDLARALATLDDADLQATDRNRAREMGRAMELYCNGPWGRLFGRNGSQPWPEDADVIVVDLGILAKEGYEDKLALVMISLINHANRLGERRRGEGRQMLFAIDESHLITRHPLLAPFLAKASKMWRKLGIWLWLATQNLVDDFPDHSRRILAMIEWWLCLALPKKELNELESYRKLNAEQRSLLGACVKAKGKYTEGTLLHGTTAALFRVVPPPLVLALAMTDEDEVNERHAIMQALGCDELEAAGKVARRIERAVDARTGVGDEQCNG